MSISFSAEIVHSADAYLFAGPIFNDYSSVGYSLLLVEEKVVIVHPDRMIVANGPNEGLLQALAKRLDRNTTAFKNNSRIHIPDGLPLKTRLNNH